MLLSHLSEDLIQFLFDYLDYEEKIQFLTSNTTFSQRFLRRSRRKAETMSEMMASRARILSLIEDPYQQLIVKINHYPISIDQYSSNYFPRSMAHYTPLQGVKLVAGTLYWFMTLQSLFLRIRELQLTINPRARNCSTLLLQLLQSLAERNVQQNEFSLGLLHLKIEKEEDEDDEEEGEDYNNHHQNNLEGEEENNDHEDDDEDDDEGVKDDGTGIPFIPNLVSLELHSIAYKSISSQYYSSLHKLILKDCARLKDVSGLGNIYDLTLDHCPRVRDITALQNNHTIKILNCRNVDNYLQSFRNSINITIDISSPLEFPSSDWRYWSGVQSLSISHCIFNNNNPTFLQLPSSIRQCQIQSGFSDFPKLVGCEKLRSLSISLVYNIDSMEPLGTIPTLELNNVHNLVSLEGLGRGNRKVIIHSCNKITDFSPLRVVETVTIIRCDGFTHIAHVDHVRNLKLESRHVINDYNALRGHTQHLTLVSVCEIPPLRGIEEIPIIELEVLYWMNTEPLKVLHSLIAGKHEKIIFHLNKNFYFESLFKAPTSDCYSRATLRERGGVIVYLRK